MAIASVYLSNGAAKSYTTKLLLKTVLFFKQEALDTKSILLAAPFLHIG